MQFWKANADPLRQNNNGTSQSRWIQACRRWPSWTGCITGCIVLPMQVGGIPTQPLWKIWKSVGVIIPNIWKIWKCSKPPTSIKTKKLGVATPRTSRHIHPYVIYLLYQTTAVRVHNKSCPQCFHVVRVWLDLISGLFLMNFPFLETLFLSHPSWLSPYFWTLTPALVEFPVFSNQICHFGVKFPVNPGFPNCFCSLHWRRPRSASGFKRFDV